MKERGKKVGEAIALEEGRKKKGLRREREKKSSLGGESVFKEERKKEKECRKKNYTIEGEKDEIFIGGPKERSGATAGGRRRRGEVVLFKGVISGRDCKKSGSET